MKVGKYEIFVFTNCFQWKIERTPLIGYVDYDWAFWTLRIRKKLKRNNQWRANECMDK